MLANAIDTNSDLKKTIFEWMHRTIDFTNIRRIVELGEDRLNAALRTPEQETFLELVMTTNPEPLPLDFNAVQSVSVGSWPLQAVPSARALLTDRVASGQAYEYAIEGRSIRVAPGGPQTLQMVYYAQFERLNADPDTNVILSYWPSLYLYSCLSEAHIWVQDFQKADIMLEKLAKEVELVNANSSAGRYGSGLMKEVC